MLTHQFNKVKKGLSAKLFVENILLTMERKRMETQLIIDPLARAIIGLITNGIAIKMIFRFLYAKYLREWRISTHLKHNF